MKIKPKTCKIRLLDGIERTMVFDGNAMAAIEESTGMNLLKDLIKLQEMKSPLIFLAKFFASCLQDELTWEQVAQLMLPAQVPEAFMLMGRLMGQESDPKSLAPFVPTHPDVVKRSLEVAKLKKGERFVDIGCGDGRTLEAALRDFGAAHVDGYEMHAERAEKCAERLLKEYAGKYTIWQHDFMDIPEESYAPLKTADVVFVYLLTASNNRVAPILEKYCKKGCRIVSHDFTFGNWVGYEATTLRADDGRSHGIYAYEIGTHLDSSLNASAVTDIPDVSGIHREGWTPGTNRQGMPVFRAGELAAVVWDGGRWFGRVAGPGNLPIGPFDDAVTAMIAVDATIKAAEQAVKATEEPAKEPVKG